MEKRSVASCEQSLASGNRHLENNKLEDAERDFASAVREVHAWKNKEHQTAIALKGLGLVYKARGSINNSGEDLVKASGLFISSLARLQECNAENEKEIIELREEISNVHTAFIKEVLQSQHSNSGGDFQKHERYKESLQKIRENCQLKIKKLDEDMPPFDPDVRDINAEKKRTDYTQQLYKDISESMKDLITCMVDDCLRIMPSPPCKFSVLGLGSTAREEATPYSDLEFCILVEENTDDAQRYFTDFTNFLHLKVVEIGETILPSLGIKSLNDYYSENAQDDWFYDEGRRGFSFDGAMPWASKTPKGRDKTSRKPWVQSLIKTPEEMADLLTETSVFKEGYHLADVLSISALIYGDRSLFESYSDSMKEHLKKTVSNCHSPEVNSDSTHIEPMSWKEKILQELVEAKKKYCNILWDYIRRPGESYSMKTNIYRFPSLVVRYVGKYFDVECPSSWETIDKLVTAEILAPEGADNLRTALAIAAELRLRTYLNNQSQNEHSSSLVELSFLLQRFFCTVVPLEEALNKLPSKSLRDVMKSKLYDDNPKTKVRMYLQFGEYSKAKDILEDTCSLYDSSLNIAEAEDLAAADSFTMLGHIMISQKNASEGTECFKQAVEILERIYQRDPQGSKNRRNLGYGYENFGGSFEASEQFDDALFYTEKSLEIRESLLKENSTAVDEVLYLRDIADSHYNLSALLIKREIRNPSDKHNFATAITHCERTLKVANILLEHYNIVYCNHVVALCGLGYCFYKLDDFKKSFEYFDNALEVLYKNRKYDVFTERELKWVTVCGSASLTMKDWEKARIMYNRAYEILTHIHGDNDDDSVAKLLINLGRVSEGEEKYEEALEFYRQAIEMSKRIHGDGSDNESLQRFKAIAFNALLTNIFK